MNRYHCIISDEEGTGHEIYFWASTMEKAEELAIYTWIADYFSNEPVKPFYVYSRLECEKKKTRSEFLLGIHKDTSGLQDCKTFLIELKKCRGKKLYHSMIYS